MSCSSECFFLLTGNEEPEDEYRRQLKTKYSSNLLVVDMAEKEALFDELVTKFEVPPAIIASA